MVEPLSRYKQAKNMRCLILLHIVIFMARHVAAEDESCPVLYSRYSKDHSYCLPQNPNCQILNASVVPKDVEIILKEHNNYRNEIATGMVAKLPTASNMLQMVWDDELATVAQKRATQCAFEHDCSNCRRVSNFGVGQNLAIEYITGSPNIPEPNWPLAIKNWYGEVEYFEKNAIDPFIPAPTYGHFTQVVWADTWRIGCGYVLYQERNMYKKLYVCNYGPAGNVKSRTMYEQGQPCSTCPLNSCCGETSGTADNYPGLCKITDNKAPVYKPKDTYFFYCNFQNQSDCAFSTSTGTHEWLTYNTLSGSFVSIILKGNEESSITFANKLKPEKNSFCLVTSYRKGPNKDGEEENNKAIETVKIISSNFEVKQELSTFPAPFRHQFSAFSMHLGWNMETELKIAFSVPPGKPDQFFEIKEVYAYDGACKTSI